MKRIAIFCDGTWNKSDAPFPTNVLKLSQRVRRTASDGKTQHVAYVEGVGTGRGPTRLSRRIDRALGGAFGLGLNLNLEEAYRNLVFTYEPGDEIHLFGFSRGAFTARSLAGFIRSAGIPDRSKVADIPKALARYRSHLKRTHPDHVESFEFRRRYCPALTTSPAEVDWRKENGHPVGKPLSIAYIGVWDTVGSLGVPTQFSILSSIFNGPHRFHDLALSRSVAAARHAVAIDEHRRTFAPTLWDNLDMLNDGSPRNARAYRQEWFPGIHGSVGGGGDICGLSDAAARWIAEGAEAAGLEFEPGTLEALKKAEDPATPLRNRSLAPGLVERILAVTTWERDGPDSPEDVSEIARARWTGDRTYRPPTLERIAKDLDDR